MTMHTKVHRGVTLVELLVIIVILGVVAMLLLPAVQRARESGRRTHCEDRLRKMGAAFQLHNRQWQHFASAGGYSPEEPWNLPRTMTAEGKPQPAEKQNWGWAYQILPYMDAPSLYLLSDPSDEDEVKIAGRPHAMYVCPSRRVAAPFPGRGCGIPDGPRGPIDYAGNGGWANVLEGVHSTDTPYPKLGCEKNANGTVIPADGTPAADSDRVGIGIVPDGESWTILLGERSFNPAGSSLTPDEDNGYVAGYTWDTIRWGYSPPLPDRLGDAVSSTRFGSAHAQVANFVMADGSTRPIAFTIDAEAFRALCGRSDGAMLQKPMIQKP